VTTKVRKIELFLAIYEVRSLTHFFLYSNQLQFNGLV
jgi:hypothetical protein